MNTGGVLTRSSSNFLYPNGLQPTDVGIKKDSISEGLKLILKKDGLTIPLNSKIRVSQTCYDGGAWRGLLVTMNDICPCDKCDYEYGLKVVSQYQHPGVFNSEMYPRKQFYGGKLSSVTCDNGKIDDATLLLMENEIIKQINSYEPEYKEPGIYIPKQHASRYYIFSEDDNTDPSIVTITIDGVSTTCTSAPDGRSIVEAINEKTELNGNVTAVYLGAYSKTYEFAIFSENGTIFTAVAGTDTTLKSRHILITNKHKELLIGIETHPSLSSVKGINIARLLNNGSSEKYDFTFKSGSSTATKRKNSNSGGDAAFSFSAQNYELIGGWYCTKVGNDRIFAFTPTDGAYIYDNLKGNYDLVLATKTGNWGTLTSDDVFRVFAYEPNYGTLAQQTYRPNNVIKDERYCKFIISWEDEIADLVGANHMNSMRGCVNLYVPQSTIHNNVFCVKDLFTVPLVGAANFSWLDFVDTIKTFTLPS